VNYLINIYIYGVQPVSLGWVLQLIFIVASIIFIGLISIYNFDIEGVELIQWSFLFVLAFFGYNGFKLYF